MAGSTEIKLSKGTAAGETEGKTRSAKRDSKPTSSTNTKAKTKTTDEQAGKPIYRRGGDTGREWGDNWPYPLRLGIGIILTINFVIFWAFPIWSQGQLWRKVLCPFLRPVYQYFDNNKHLRAFAAKYIYRNPRHADFFFQACLVNIGWGLPFLYILYQQVKYGTLTWLQIYFYYFAWVGFGGRIMGSAYTFAHKEGHNNYLYKPWLANTIGNWFENWIGSFFGNLPYNFSTSHIYIHHRLNAGSGDTFYQWDLDRTSWKHFMIFLHRIILHTIGISSFMYFLQNPRYRKQAFQLAWGIVIYWVIVPTMLFKLTHSWSFFFFVYIQPQICMTFFLAFMNYAFHAFIDYNEDGRHITCVNSTLIVGGDDDYFGEDDHMAHHNATHVYWRDLPAFQKTQYEKWRTHNASVFRGLSIVELAALILFKDWNSLAEHYVQFNDGDEHDVQEPNNAAWGSLAHGKRTDSESKRLCELGSENLTETFKSSVWNRTGRLNKEEIIAMLKSRATRLEPRDIPYEVLPLEEFEGMGDPDKMN